MSKDFNAILAAAIKDTATVKKGIKVDTKGGKKYLMVQDRVQIFRKHFGIHGRIDTEQVVDGDYIRSETTIWINGEMVANGLAEEVRGSTFINKTSAIENSETSAIGRALSNLGLMGSEYASAEEMVNALKNQKKVSDHTNGNKSISSKDGQIGLPGFDKLNLADQVKHFAEQLVDLKSPGSVNKVATAYKPWIESLTGDNKKEVVGIYERALKEVTNA
jgi:hypothetical protein